MNMVKMTFKELSPELTEEEVRELEAAELRSPVYEQRKPDKTNHFVAAFSCNAKKSKTVREGVYRLSQPASGCGYQ